MQLKILSDLHMQAGFDTLEFKKFGIKLNSTDHQHQTLVLAGDELTWGRQYRSWMANVAHLFKHVVVVPGNHFYYGQDIKQVKMGVESWNAVECPSNVHLLDNRSIVLDGVHFVGSTLWTDMKKNDPLVKLAVEQGLNDFRYIHNGGGMAGDQYLTAAATVEFHQTALAFIEKAVSEFQDMPTVILTHHMPSLQSVHEMYRSLDNSGLNHGFASDLDDFIYKLSPDYWIHGHTHSSCSYRMGQTKVICNPAGIYMPDHFAGLGFENPDFDPDLVVEI